MGVGGDASIVGGVPAQPPADIGSRVKVRLLLAKFWGADETPTIVSCVDATIWEHWEDEDETAWRDSAKRTWGLDPSDCEWTEVWAAFDPVALRGAFTTPVVEGTVDV